VAEIKERLIRYNRIEITCDESELEKVYRYLERKFKDVKVVTSKQGSQHHFVLKTDEEKVLENNFVI